MPHDTVDPFAAGGVAEGMLDPKHADVAGTLRGAVDPTTWSRTDWIMTIAPLVVEAAAIGAPEVTLPLVGAIDLAKAFKVLSSSVIGREATSAAAGAVAARMRGDPMSQGAGEGIIANLLGEGFAGVGKILGRTAKGGIREATLGKSSKELRNLITEKLPHLAPSMQGRPATDLGGVFGRERIKSGRSPAEELYGGLLDPIEDEIDHALNRPGKGPLLKWVTNARGVKMPVRQGAHQELFPVHQMVGHHQWVVNRVPFKEAVSLMREKWPKGYRLTGSERDGAIANEWRQFRNQDSRAIAAHLKSVDPGLADKWQSARHDWELAHTFADMFSDPLSFDTTSTGEVNTQQLANHLYGRTPAGINQKLHISRVAGADYANKIHGAISHQKPSPRMSQFSDVLKEPGEMGKRIGLTPHPPFFHLSLHPERGAFYPHGTEVPFKEMGRAKASYAGIRALTRHGAVQAKEAILGEDE